MITWTPEETLIDAYDRGDAFVIHISAESDEEGDELIGYTVPNILTIPLDVLIDETGITITATKVQTSALFNKGSISYSVGDDVDDIITVGVPADVPEDVNIIEYVSDPRIVLNYPIQVGVEFEIDGVDARTYTLQLNNNWSADVELLGNIMATKNSG